MRAPTRPREARHRRRRPHRPRPGPAAAAPAGSTAGGSGLAMFHTLFMREHNAICDRLAAAYPSWDDDRLFDHARLVNAALIAKIHTVEWTTGDPRPPGAADRRCARTGAGSPGSACSDLVGRRQRSEVISGIPGSATDHHCAPYSITEEFVAVYRMHPLIPDELDVPFADRPAGAASECTFLDTRGCGRVTRCSTHRRGRPALLASARRTRAPSSLHNYPRFMQQFRRDDGVLIDLAAIDILRSASAACPATTSSARPAPARRRPFEELSDTRRWRRARRSTATSRRSTSRSGCYAEKPPAGFGFSDTAFRIFILMASRRLKSDRFFTYDFTPRTTRPRASAGSPTTT